ncbi:MAG: SurA N-terminal domain-containing protein [Campylobacterota bacterium]|nr:SurA N-terminal domain-containing protein [Campylobacterota bacterium]
MITWMQRHRKYLVVTMWISAIAFIGAGFVGWGQYSYGEKATAVAKVGTVDISMRELQQGYSRLYSKYNQLFQGNFDEAQAKSFGLQKQAMKQLIDQTLILNLAQSYGLVVGDDELLAAITSETAFNKDGKFDKETYRKVLQQNRLSIQDFEADMKKSLLIQKTLELFPKQSLPLEKKALNAVMLIADKIDYKILTADMITIDRSDEALKQFWEKNTQNYMTLPAYNLQIITQERVSSNPDDAAIEEHYNANRHNFTDAESKILSLEEAKPAVIAALDEKATHKAALKQYIAFKKEKLDPSTTINTATINEKEHSYSAEIFSEIMALTPASPYLKPRKTGNSYQTIKLVSSVPSKVKTFEAAKAELLKDFAENEKSTKLQELANNSLATFSGQQSPFITRDFELPLDGLSEAETKLFIEGLFKQSTKRGSITLNNEKIVLFHILEQKMLKTSKTDQENSVLRLKTTLLDQGLIKMLENKFSVEIYIEGL